MRDVLERQIDQALGRVPADLVVRNARIRACPTLRAYLESASYVINAPISVP
jgi:hypothetical protein